MKNSIWLVTTIFLSFQSCNNSEPINEHQTTSDTSKIEEIAELETCYDTTNDVSDSLIMVFEEILEKKIDYNQAKYDKTIKDWCGKSIYIKQIPIDGIVKSDTYTGPHLIMEYGSYKGFAYSTHINIFLNFENNDDLVLYENGQLVDVKGVISSGNAGNVSYSLHLACGEIITN